jgi:hypothetical protein
MFSLSILLIFLQVVTQFLTMETLLDDSVGREIDLQIERGGTPLTLKLEVFCNFGTYYLIVATENGIYVLRLHSYRTTEPLCLLS